MSIALFFFYFYCYSLMCEIVLSHAFSSITSIHLVFDPKWPSFELNHYIYRTIALIKFHTNWDIHLGSRVLKRVSFNFDWLRSFRKPRDLVLNYITITRPRYHLNKCSLDVSCWLDKQYILARLIIRNKWCIKIPIYDIEEYWSIRTIVINTNITLCISLVVPLFRFSLFC